MNSKTISTLVVFAMIMCETREITILLVSRDHSYVCHINLVKIKKKKEITCKGKKIGG